MELSGIVDEADSLASDYMYFRLREELSKEQSFRRHVNGARDEIYSVRVETGPKFSILRKAAREVEETYVRQFGDMFTKLRIERSTARCTYNSIANEVFQDGVNWGRICGLYSFAGAFAVYLVKKGNHDLLKDIPGWVSSYIDKNLKEWIADHGGWDGLVEHFSDHTERRAKSVWNSVAMVGGFLAGLTVVAYKLSH